MRIVTLTTVAALALAAAACNNSNDENQMSTDINLAEDNSVNDVLGADAMGDAAAVPTDAAGFADAAAAGDLYEIESAKLAVKKASNTDIRSLAQHIRTDHQKSSAELKAIASQANLTLTPELDAEKQAMLDQLRAADGAEFDRLFLEQQKTAHQKAMSLLQGYAAGGDNAALKDFASRTAGAVKSHLDHANTIKL